jgi:nitrogen fixation NifU-like protein
LDRPFAELDDLYRDVVLDHYRSPRGREQITEPDVRQEGFNPVCGDEVVVALSLDGGEIREAQVKSRGCAISVASGSMMAEMLPGRTREEIERVSEAFRMMLHGAEVPPDLDVGDLDALRGVSRFPVRIKCAMLPWMTLQQALESHVRRRLEGDSAATTEEANG